MSCRQRSTDRKTIEKRGIEDVLHDGSELYPLFSISLLIVTGTALKDYPLSLVTSFGRGLHGHDKENPERPRICSRMRNRASRSFATRSNDCHTGTASDGRAARRSRRPCRLDDGPQQRGKHAV